MSGKNNLSAGFLFMVYDFLLLDLWGFALGKEKWVAPYSVGKHSESRLALMYSPIY